MTYEQSIRHENRSILEYTIIAVLAMNLKIEVFLAKLLWLCYALVFGFVLSDFSIFPQPEYINFSVKILGFTFWNFFDNLIIWMGGGRGKHLQMSVGISKFKVLQQRFSLFM